MDAYTINEKYYVLAQYTKFIRPGDTFIAIDDSQSLTAYNPKPGRLVFVTTNNTDTGINVTYDLSLFRHRPLSQRAYQTSATEKLAPLPGFPMRDRKFTAALPAHSVTTFVFTNSPSVPSLPLTGLGAN